MRHTLAHIALISGAALALLACDEPSTDMLDGGSGSADAGDVPMNRDAGDVPMDRDAGSGRDADTPQCPSGQLVCEGECTVVRNDPANCGACGNACEPGQVCSDGSCEVTCAVGQQVCDGICVNTRTDREHCGACDNACGAGELCDDGACVTSCPGSQSECDGMCFDLQSSRHHCGACGTACASGETCTAGTCTSVCPPGHVNCGGACVSLDTNRDNCGACGTVCGASETCVAGACASSCPSGQTNCSGACVDTQTHGDHCGACGTACSAGEICTAGTCTPSACRAAAPVPLWTGSACAASTLDCLAACTDVACRDACFAADPDPANCNGCFSRNSVHCANNNGCSAEWDCYDACIEDNCPSDASCATTTCAAQVAGYQTCMNALPSGTCNSELLACFASSCPEDIVPLWTGPACSSATATCINGCADNACVDACLAADPNPMDCNGCINQDLISCYNDNGCQAQWNCYVECASVNGSDACTTEWAAYEACYDAVPAGTCNVNACFTGV